MIFVVDLPEALPSKRDFLFDSFWILPFGKLTVRTWKWMVGIRLFPFGMAYFQGRGPVSFRECIFPLLQSFKNRKHLRFLVVNVWLLRLRSKAIVYLHELSMVHAYVLSMPHLPVPYNNLEPGVDGYLIYWVNWELGSKYIGNWKIRVLYNHGWSTKPPPGHVPPPEIAGLINPLLPAG